MAWKDHEKTLRMLACSKYHKVLQKGSLSTIWYAEATKGKTERSIRTDTRKVGEKETYCP